MLGSAEYARNMRGHVFCVNDQLRAAAASTRSRRKRPKPDGSRPKRTRATPPLQDALLTMAATGWAGLHDGLHAHGA